MDINEKIKDQLKDGTEGKLEESQSDLTTNTSTEGPTDESSESSDNKIEEVNGESTISPSGVANQLEAKEIEKPKAEESEPKPIDSNEEKEAETGSSGDSSIEETVEKADEAADISSENHLIAEKDSIESTDSDLSTDKEPAAVPDAAQTTVDLTSEESAPATDNKIDDSQKEVDKEEPIVVPEAVESAVPTDDTERTPATDNKSDIPQEEVEKEEPNVVLEATESTVPALDKQSAPATDNKIDVAQEGVVEEKAADKSEEVSSDKEAEESHLDYSSYTKKQMVQVLESFLKEDDLSQIGRILKEIKKPYDKLANKERKDAYNRYIEDGGEKDGFEFRLDELSQRFETAYGKLKERRNQYFNSLEKQKEQNLNLKLDILEKLRHIVDSEETGSSIKALKELQNQWKEVGMIPSSQNKSLWANYNALLDRFYDQRSIYFELKELDRKKNFDLKIELCEKAEQLSQNEDIREVIRQLNELHNEFKHIGPVPKDDQDAVWERFKAASDKIYAKRKDYYEKLKSELQVNEVAKESLVEKLLPLADFASDRISDWNAKTKEIIAIQKEWEAIGSLPKEKAKAINKQFWTSFKSFFNKKNQFFKKIEEERKDNLQLKRELVQKAEELKESADFRKTSDELKQLQKRWKDIGPVPEKYRNEVFLQFKSACDHFFNRRRANIGQIEKDYEQNLEKKQELCKELEDMIKSDKPDLERLKKIEAEWNEIGYVPKESIRSIQKRYTDAVTEATEKIDIPDAEKHKLRFSAQFHNLNYGPGSEKLIQKKEGALRRQISNLENDINLWRNNIDFFAASKNADKLKKDFQVKIDSANAQLKSLKEQLKVISNI